MSVRAHWVSFDPVDMRKVRETLSRGSGFKIVQTYNHPTDMSRTVLQLESEATYEELDLAVNSLSSPLRYHHRKPAGLGGGFSVEKFEAIYGRLMTTAAKEDARNPLDETQ